MRSFVLLILASARLLADDLYVSPRGSDKNPGTLAQPLRTIAAATAKLQPGDTAWVRGGTYRERISFPRSGTGPSNWISLRAYPGERPIVDGTRLPVPDDNAALLLIADRSHIVVSGFIFQNYVATRGDKTPCGLLITGECDNLEIRNNRVRNIRYRARNGNAFGIAVYGTSPARPIHRVLIDGNEIDHCKLGNSESLTLNGNVSECRVSNNRVHDNDNIGIVFIGFEGTCPDNAQDQARDCVCRDNKVWNISSYGNPAYGRFYSAGGIYVDGGTRILIERNVSHHCDIGIELASEHAGRATSDVEVRENIVYRNRVGGIFLGGYDENRGASMNNVIHHNTLFQNDTRADGNGEIYLQHYTSGNSLTHNIVVTGKQGLVLANPTQTNTGTKLSRNLYFTPGGGEDLSWQWLGTSGNGISAFRLATTQDSDSIFGDPRFANARRFDLHLTDLSPARDAGEPNYLPGSDELDFDNGPRISGGTVDIGADEY